MTLDDLYVIPVSFMPNSTLTVLPDARAKLVAKQHLLGDPYSVSSHDYDSNKVDTSHEHREYMRKKLYVPKTTQKDVSKTQVFNSQNSYADEELPKWMSTMKQEYPVRDNVCDREAAKMLAKTMTGTHFVLESPGGDRNVMKSSTKMDFIKHHYSIVPLRYQNHLNEKKYSLTDFEGGELLPRKQNKFQLKERLDERRRDAGRPGGNISLGNDGNDWKSVSNSDWIQHPIQGTREPTEYETLEKKRSTVIENPDLVLEPMITVKQAEFALAENLDRSTLIYDNTVSKKALKGTHFTLGNDEKMQARSEYLLSFVPLNSQPTKPIGAKGSDKSCIIAEDHDARTIDISSQKLDYKPITNFQPVTSQFEIKKENSKSSIGFGQGEPIQSISLSKQDYAAPNKYGQTPKFTKHAGYKGCNYSLIAMDDNDKVQYTSVQKTDYVPKDMTLLQRVEKLVHPSTLKLDSEPEHKFRATSFTHQVFTDPQEKKHLVPQKGAGMTAEGSLVSRENDMFQYTVNNTITRYPYTDVSYETTVKETYKGVSAEKVPCIKPKSARIDDNVHPTSRLIESQNGIQFKPIRDMSTVSRRTYVAPEVMKEYTK